MVMMDVQPGTLAGEDLAAEEQDTPIPGQTTVDEQLAEAAGEPETPVEQREEPAPDPRPATRKGGAPSRTYVVLEQSEFEEGGEYTVEVHRVEARNATNAIRKAFRELAAQRPDQDEATIVVVPESMWRPTPVRLKRSESVSVSIGAAA
jgi:hypothetical protein